jgi:7-keto-8-aminopelargonate synthetase-like enzyme
MPLCVGTVPLDADALRRVATARVVGNVRSDAVPGAAEVESNGARLINVSTTDLLGLGSDTRVREAAQAAQRTYGLTRTERSKVRDELEDRLRGLLGVEAVAVLEDADAVLTCLVDVGVAVEARLSPRMPAAPGVSFPEEVGRALTEGALAVVTEAVDRLTGEFLPLHRYAEATQRAGGSLVVVDSVGLGVLGPSGLGAVESLGLKDHVALQLLCLGEALPGVGGAVAGPTALVDALRGCGPAPAPAWLAASSRALQIAAAEEHRRARAFDVAQAMIDGLRALGLDTGPCVTPWIPVWMGEESLCEQWLRALADANVACRGLLAKERSRLLLSVAATATDAQVEAALEAFGKVARKLPPPRLDEPWKGPVLLARPGSFAIATPCAPHWRPFPFSAPPPAPAVAPPAAAGLRERLFDAVETLTWRATNRRSGRLGLPGARALKALFDRRRR